MPASVLWVMLVSTDPHAEMDERCSATCRSRAWDYQRVFPVPSTHQGFPGWQHTPQHLCTTQQNCWPLHGNAKGQEQLSPYDFGMCGHKLIPTGFIDPVNTYNTVHTVIHSQLDHEVFHWQVHCHESDNNWRHFICKVLLGIATWWMSGYLRGLLMWEV